MHTISKVFVDTNVFVAIRDENDSTHKDAIRINKILQEMGVKFCVTSDVINETLTVLSNKLGKQVVRDWFNDFQKSQISEVLIDDILIKETRKFFMRVKSKNISFVDCSSVVAMKRNKIEVIFSFDEHFRQMGVKLAGDVFK